MYRIILADDEGIVLESMKMIIQKNFPGQFYIETAKTGRDVIELAETFRPDIAFMDIQMPGINGIDAMREIKKTNSNIIFVVLTAYDRFDYAKESANMGVFEYMNKPFKPEDIIDVLNRVTRSIESSRKKRSDDLRIREKMETVTPIIENGLIYAMMFQDFAEEDVENYKQLLEIDSDYGCMLVFSVGEDQYGNTLTNTVGAGVKIQNFYPQIRETIKESWFDSVVGSIISSKIPVFLPRNRGKMEYEERIAIIERCREISRSLQKLTDCRFRIGIGSVKPLNESLESYEEAMKALATSSGKVAHVDDLPIQRQYDEEYPIELENKIFTYLSEGKKDLCATYAGEFFDWMINTYDETSQSVRLKVLEFVLRADQQTFLQGGITYHFNGREDYLKTVFEAEKNSQLKGWFVEHIVNNCTYIANKQINHENHVIGEAKSYIEANYSKDISLDDLSRKMDLSPYYFSKLFKEEAGVTFMEYLTNLRMERAKDLLKNSNLSMKEICVEVGYSDPNYFSRIFKKNMDMTPTEFREQ